MNRRDTIKTISLSLGCTVATPTLIGILNSCENPTNNWKPEFLSLSQVDIIDTLVDIILPKTNTPGGLDLNITQFIDKMIANTEEKKDQQLFKKGGLAFKNTFITVFKKDISKGTKAEFNALLDTYFNVSNDKEQDIFKTLQSGIRNVPEKKTTSFLIYHFLTKIRYYSLFVYFTSQPILENEFHYNVNLGYYRGCVDL